MGPYLGAYRRSITDPEGFGAVHSVVFGGFGPGEPAAPIDDARPVVIVATSCGIEPTRVVPPGSDGAVVIRLPLPPGCVPTPWNDDEPYASPFAARPTSRFRSRRAEMGKLIEGRAEILQSRPVGRPAGTIKQGDRVFHTKFGYGRVEEVEGNKLDIAFEKSGRKKVIDSFVEPA